MKGPDQVIWLDRLDQEHDNLRAALDFCRSPSASAEDLVRLASALGRFWHTRGYLSEGMAYLEAAIEREGPVEPTLRAKALTWAGNLAYEHGDFTAAKKYHERNLAIQRESGNERGIAAALGNLGLVALRCGEYDAATDLLEQTLAVAEELEDEWILALTQNNLGLIALEEEDYARAIRHYEQSLAKWRELGHTAAAAAVLGNLGIAATGLGDFDLSWRYHVESLTQLRKLEDRTAIATALEGLLHLAVAREQHSRAARLLGAANALRERIGAPLPPNEREGLERDKAAVVASMGAASFEEAFNDGRNLALDQAVAYALDESTWDDLGMKLVEPSEPGDATSA
jgi:non-specific serine/threonine protein kinase